MKPDPKILDDIAKVAGGAVNVISGMQQQIQEEIQSRVEHMASRMDLVPRDELDDALAMIAKLQSRITEIEERLEGLESKASPSKKKKGKSK